MPSPHQPRSRSAKNPSWRRALALAGLAATTGAVAVRQRQVRRAAPELHSPVLYPEVTVNAAFAGLANRILEQRAKRLPEDVERVAIPGPAADVEALLVRPRNGVLRGAMLWIHGGGRVIGNAVQDLALCQEAADTAGVLVLGTNYRLAPEHPCPAALDDCMASLRWLVDHARSFGIDPVTIAVAGASAGGGLAAELAQRAHDEGIELAFQVLVYPMLDDRTLDHGPADRGHLVWTPESNRYGWSAYLGHPAGQAEDRRYAVAARRGSLAGLPPAWIGVGDLDLFHDEDVAYAERLRQAGVDVHLHVEAGMYHGADSLPGVRNAPSMRAFRRRAWQALRSALDATS